MTEIKKLICIMKSNRYNQLVFNRENLFFAPILLCFLFIFSSSFAQQTSWIAPKDADNVKNPLTGNSSVIADAKALYISYCTPCHGDKGRGDGPAAPGLNPRPADHTSSSVQLESDGSLYWKLSEGKSPMPGYKKILTEQQRWGLINYIRTLAKGAKKS
jgi:mono/diheme cytochrome c family protein